MATRSSTHFKNECLRSADLGGDLKVLLVQQTCSAPRDEARFPRALTLECKVKQQGRASAVQGSERAKLQQIQRMA